MITDVNPFVYSHPSRRRTSSTGRTRRAGSWRMRSAATTSASTRRASTARRASSRRALRDGERRRGADPDPRRPLPGLLDRRRDGAARAGVREAPQGRAPLADRGVPPAHRRRALARRARDQRPPPARARVRPVARAARAPRPAAPARVVRRLPRADRVRRVSGHRAVARLDGLLRSHIQHHGEVASYVFAGSEPALMRAALRDERAAALRLGGADAARAPRRPRPRRLRRRCASRRRAAASARRSGRCSRRLGATHSARCCSPIGSGRRSPEGAEATLDHWDAAHAAALRELEAEFDAEWRGLDVSQQKTLRALLLGDGSPYRSAALRRLELTKDVVRRALPRLAATAEIEAREEGGYSLVDPLFAEWVGRLNDRAFVVDAGDPWTG